MKPGISLASLLCCLGSAIASAATSSPQDFASGFRVEAAGSIAEAVPAVIGRLVRRAGATDTRR